MLSSVLKTLKLLQLTFQAVHHYTKHCYTFTGSGYGLVYLPAATMIGYYFDRRMYLASSVATVGGVGFGLIVIGPIIQSLVEEYSWRGAMLIHAGLALQLCIAGTLLKPMDNSFTREDANWAEQPIDLSLLKNYHVVIFCVNNLAWVSGVYAAFVMMYEFADSSFLGDRRSAFLLSFLGLAYIVGRFMAGVLANHPRCEELWVYNLATLVLGVTVIIFPGIMSEVVLGRYYTVV